MSLMCSCEKGCLISKNSLGECREFIRTLRQSFYKKSYNEQNYILSHLMDVKVSPVGRKRVTYGTVCRGAFMKCYGFSHAKNEVLLNKMEDDGVSIQEDMRGKHGNHALKLLPEAEKIVIEFICSKKASKDSQKVL